jgi:hypothetical protein
MSGRASHLDEFFGTTYATENGLDSSGSGQKPMAGSSEHGKEPSNAIKCEERFE